MKTKFKLYSKNYNYYSMRLKTLQLPFIILISFLLHACSPEQKFYISPDGDDLNSGSKNHSFATLERAKLAIKRNKNKPITIFMREGYYPLKKSFILTDEEVSGDNPVLITSYPGEDVHLIGGRKINGFEALDEHSEAVQKIPLQFHKSIRQINLKGLGIEDYGEISSRGFGRAIQASGLELFFNGKPMTIARWPNEAWATIEDVPEALEGKGFSYSGNRPAKWLNAKDIWFHGYWKWDWSDSYVKMAAIDTIAKVIMTEVPYSNYPYTQGKRFYAFNILEELDAPGEWYLDRETGVLYFWPPSDPEEAEIFVSLLQDPLIKLNNTKHITLKGLIIEYTCGAGVEIIGGSDNLIEDCKLQNIGTVAVSFGKLAGNIGGLIAGNTLYNGDAGTENGIIACEIHSTGEGGIILGGGDRKTLSPGKNFAMNNNIYDCSRWVRTYRAGIFMYGVGNIAVHNLIHDLPHTAIFFW
ncbi:MAG: right-handed parallel beta-helix repeat-containing protein, partial [Bacteroidales bacterium]|nr:right-handed parallel beta-helix repeat-containing protein [Bacteroidales bacterium]